MDDFTNIKNSISLNQKILAKGTPGGVPLNRRVKPAQHPPSQPDVPPEESERQPFRSRHPQSEPQAQQEQPPYSPEPRSLEPVHSTPQRSQYAAPSPQLARLPPRG